jgi:hypothetical protein
MRGGGRVRMGVKEDDEDSLLRSGAFFQRPSGYDLLKLQ